MRRFVTRHTLRSDYRSGCWAVIDGMLIVRTNNGSKAAQLGSLSPESLARILFRELAAEQQEDAA